MSAYLETAKQAVYDGWKYVNENSTPYIPEIPAFTAVKRTVYNTWKTVETFSYQHGGQELIEHILQVQTIALSSLMSFSQLEVPTEVSMEQATTRIWRNINEFSRQYIGNELLELMHKLECICYTTLIYTGATLLFLSNSSVFVIGACVGVTCTATMDTMIADITGVFERIMREKDFPRLGLMITASVLAWPITMAVCAFFVGGYYGSLMKKPAVNESQVDAAPSVQANLAPYPDAA